MTAPRYPAGVNGPATSWQVARPAPSWPAVCTRHIRAEYFRIGHMGAVNTGDILATMGAIEDGLVECGYQPPASGVAAAQAAYYP